MLNQSIKLLLLCVSVTPLIGCKNTKVVEATVGNYRTITAEPRRNTEAAIRSNEAGLRHLADGELDDATEAFSRALNQDVEYGPAHNNLGKVYYRQKDWYRAAWEFEHAGKLLPRHAEPRNNLGLVLEQTGELDRAIDHYRAAVGLDPDQVAYRANLARALVRRGDRTEEVRNLLAQIVEQDTRPEWLLWAKRQQVSVGVRYE